MSQKTWVLLPASQFTSLVVFFCFIFINENKSLIFPEPQFLYLQIERLGPDDFRALSSANSLSSCFHAGWWALFRKVSSTKGCQRTASVIWEQQEDLLPQLWPTQYLLLPTNRAFMPSLQYQGSDHSSLSIQCSFPQTPNLKRPHMLANTIPIFYFNCRSVVYFLTWSYLYSFGIFLILSDISCVHI